MQVWPTDGRESANGIKPIESESWKSDRILYTYREQKEERIHWTPIEMERNRKLCDAKQPNRNF